MINEFYMSKETQTQISQAFLANKPNQVVLQSFLLEERYNDFLKKIKVSKKEHVKVPNKFSYTVCNQKDINEFFCGDVIKRLIETITKKYIKKINVLIKEFNHRDYTVLHDEEVIGNQLQFFFILTQDEIPDDSGGNIICTLKRGEEGSLSFPPISNLFILLHTRNLDYVFHQYINHLVHKKAVTVVHGICEF